MLLATGHSKNCKTDATKRTASDSSLLFPSPHPWHSRQRIPRHSRKEREVGSSIISMRGGRFELARWSVIWAQVFQSPYHYEDQIEPLQEQVGKCLPVVIVRPSYHSSSTVQRMTLHWPFFRSTCETLERVNVGETQGEGDIKEEAEREMELLRCGFSNSRLIL